MKEMPIFIGFPAAPVTQIHWRTTGADFLRHHRVRPKGRLAHFAAPVSFPYWRTTGAPETQ